MFGYDVLIDQQCRPWLIEANASPSMSRDSALDFRVKDAMIRDTVTLVDPVPFDRAAVSRVMKRRMRDVASGKVQKCLMSVSMSSFLCPSPPPHPNLSPPHPNETN